MLDRLKVAVRARAPFEALDLGLAVLRAHAAPVYRAWLAVFLPVAVLVHGLLWRHPWWAVLALIWLKPLLGRPVLHVLGRATFGEVPSVSATFRALPLIYRRGSPATLLWRRLGPERALLLPIWQLEGQHGGDYRKRCRVLLREGRGAAFLWTLFTFGAWLLLPVSLVGLAAFLWPQGSGFDLLEAVFASEAHRVPALDAALALLPTLATALLEPFYLAGGFGLYLNRRVQLEGWDLELAFRSLAARALRLRGAALALLLVFGAPLSATPEAAPSPAKVHLQEVLKAPEFQTKTRRRTLRFKTRPKPKREPRAWNPPAWMARLVPWIGLGLKALLVSGLLGLLVWLLLRFRRSPGAASDPRGEERPPERLFGLDLRPQALPRRPGEAADALWAEGRSREALALLYRGALAHLVRVEHATVPPGATEEECVRVAQAVLPEAAAAYLARLTEAWIRVAYAGQPPRSEDRPLCAAWAQYFSGGRA